MSPAVMIRGLVLVLACWAGSTWAVAFIRGDWKILQNDPFSPLELYHLQDDPQESCNLART